MSSIVTHYDNLKLTRSAGPDDIKRQYKAKTQQHHPDKNPPEFRDQCERSMRILNEAYEVLSDPEKKRRHDEWIAREEASQNPKSKIHESEQRDSGTANQQHANSEPSKLPPISILDSARTSKDQPSKIKLQEVRKMLAEVLLHLGMQVDIVDPAVLGPRGIRLALKRLSTDTTLAKIQKRSLDGRVHGILTQVCI